MITRIVTVNLANGVHARPASELVKAANAFHSEIILKVGTTTVNAKSVLSILKLAIRNGTDVTIQVEGDDEEQALQVIANLLSGKQA